jgi:catalase
VVDKYASACDDNTTQVQSFYRKVLGEEARELLTDNVATSLIDASREVQERTLAIFKDVDKYARCVKEKIFQLLKAKEPCRSPSSTLPRRSTPRKG